VKPRAYFYLRYSNPDQEEGTSTGRQEAARDRWLGAHPEVVLDPMILRDEGVSGYTGKHATDEDYALAQFLAAVKAGRVPRGSYLLVENLDRLTRQKDSDALRLVLDFLDAGVNIVQLEPLFEFRHDRWDFMSLLQAGFNLSRGRAESERKVETVGSAWRAKKDAVRRGEPQPTDRKKASKLAGGKVLTHNMPPWLEERDGEYALIPGKVKLVRRVFQLSARGMGQERIALLLNEEGVPPLAGRKEWTESFVSRLLRNRAVIGEYQPWITTGRTRPRKDGDPIPGVYPRAITQEEWHASRAASESRRHMAGRSSGSFVNLFKGLLRDSITGRGVQMDDHGSGRVYEAKGVRPSVSFPVAAFEAAVLKQLREVDPRSLLPGEEPNAVDALTGELSEVEARIAEGRALARKKLSETVNELLVELEARRAELRAKLDEARRAAATPLSAAWEDAKPLWKKAEEGEAARLQLRAAIRRVVERIDCVFARGTGWTKLAQLTVWFKGGGVRAYAVLHHPRCQPQVESWREGGRPFGVSIDELLEAVRALGKPS
jgi:DNA invertase Pin-like site-specific DNA recombinase